jgi:hypothetical protein
MGLDEPASFGDFLRVIFVQRQLIRLAPFAWPETSFFRILPGSKKADVLPFGETRRTRGPAINACRFHGIKKRPVEAPVTSLDGIPPGAVERSKFLIVFQGADR